MKADEVLLWLESELTECPDRASGEEGYEFMIRQTQRILATDRSALVRALASWLNLRSEPRTMLAIAIAEAHHLTELKPDIEQLLREVKQGVAFKPYYATIIGRAVAKL